jgi:predicted O-methyltransferase YrrM
MEIGRPFRRRHIPAEVPLSSEVLLERIDEPFRSALLSMYRGEPQNSPDGKLQPLADLASGITPDRGLWLYDEYRRMSPRTSLETGMAYGFSTIFFLAAIVKNGAQSYRG